MARTAAERGDQLQGHLDAARGQVSDLAGRLSTLEARAREHYVGADAAAGDAAHAEADALRSPLATAQARLSALEEAALAVAQERQQEAVEARLAGLEAAIAEAAETSRRELATVLPAVSAAKRALQAALSAEDLARTLDAERHALDHQMAGRQWTRFYSNHGSVRGLIERRRFLHDLLLDPEI